LPHFDISQQKRAKRVFDLGVKRKGEEQPRGRLVKKAIVGG